MWPLSILRERRYRLRYNAALTVLLGHHYFATLPQETRERIERAVDTNLDRSALGPGRLLRRWTQAPQLVAGLPTNLDSDLIAAFRTRAMEELGVPMPIAGSTWQELLAPWRAFEHRFALGNWFDTGVRGFKGMPLSIVGSFRLTHPATAAAAEALRAAGIDVPRTFGLVSG